MEKHMTQQDLANKISMDQTQLSKIENGKNYPLPPTLWEIAKGIGCLVDDLYEAADQLPHFYFVHLKIKYTKSMSSLQKYIAKYATNTSYNAYSILIKLKKS